MNILVVGTGKGSWQMRGLQLGAALGARVATSIVDTDLRWADVVVLVKRAIGMADVVHAARKPLVWDAVDFWRQPAENAMSATQARALLRSWITRYRPTLVIGATEAMARDACGVYVPHHGHQGLHPTDARPACAVVGYDGSPAYLDRWEFSLLEACRVRGWQFVVNPADLAEVDILVALRGGPWDGWICREWKSGVKVVNAILAGRPIITQDSAAWRELMPTGSVVQDPSDLPAAFDVWASHEARQAAVLASRGRARAFSLAAIAGIYRQILAELLPDTSRARP